MKQIYNHNLYEEPHAKAEHTSHLDVFKQMLFFAYTVNKSNGFVVYVLRRARSKVKTDGRALTQHTQYC